ncbi:hypothetical protein ABIC03_007988, partial [Bradyrhizobium sp. RT6a]
TRLDRSAAHQANHSLARVCHASRPDAAKILCLTQALSAAGFEVSFGLQYWV